MAETDNASKRVHAILTKAELQAITEGLDAPVGAVAVISPRLSDQETLGPLLEARGVQVLTAGDTGTLASFLGDPQLMALIIAEELVQASLPLLSRVRADRPDLPVYQVVDAVDDKTPAIAPPSGIWPRENLATSLTIHWQDIACASGGRQAPWQDAPAHDDGPDGKPRDDFYTACLETLLLPSADPRTLVVRFLQAMSARLPLSAAGCLVRHGDFFLEITAGSPTIRNRAGRWILSAGSGLWDIQAPARKQAEGFAQVDCLPVTRGCQGLGWLFLFWPSTRSEAALKAVPDLSRLLPQFSARLWELMAYSGNPQAHLPFQGLMRKARNQPEDTLILAAPLAEESLESMLQQGGHWSREPCGAVALLLAGTSPDRALKDLQAVSGENLAAFAITVGPVQDLVAWVSARSEALAALRRAGKTGCFPEQPPAPGMP